MLSLREVLTFCCERTGLSHFAQDERLMIQMEALSVVVALAYMVGLVDLAIRLQA